MSEQKTQLVDGKYHCCATLHVKDGKLVVELDDTFGLAPGTTIPLLRKDNNLIVEELSGSQIRFFNGHAII